MEPLLLACGGCGVKIRAADPDRARARSCPRCGTPLASAVAEALRADPGRPAGRPGVAAARAVSDSISAETRRIDVDLATATASSRRRARWIALGAAVLGASSLIHLLLNPADPSPGTAGSPPRLAAPAGGPAAASPAPAVDRLRLPDGPAEIAAAGRDRDRADEAEPAESNGPTPLDLAAAEPLAGLAIRVGEANGVARPGPPAAPSPAPMAPADDDEAPPPPAAAAPLDAAQPRRLLVRDPRGAAVVAREHGTFKDQVAVVLPDGTIGWPTNRVYTDQPFEPSKIDELERALLEGDYKTFRVVKTRHYLLFYQCSEKFARDSADLLEELYEKLTAALRKQDLPVVEAEFPLVGVIFRTEDDFRANRKIAADVQAYYDILSNRIFFFEKGRRDKAAPEISALRKPQTVVHEGTHQLLHNVGIQHRMSPWPIWLVEGLAEYCSPAKPTKKGTDWAGLGQINVMHLTTIRDLDDPMSSVVRGGPKAPSGRDRGQSMVEYLVTRTDLTPTDYALSWGLTHYLARDKDRFPQFVAYIRKLNRLKPFETRTPDQQLADFREAFGKDLGKLDAQVGKHLARIKIPESQALPFYAVLIEQPVSRTAVRRMAMVSQSPSLIRQWVETASQASGGEINWQAVAHPTRTRAELTVDGWIRQRQ